MSVEREICVWARRSSVTAITTSPGLTWPWAARSTSTTIAATTPTANTSQPRASRAALSERGSDRRVTDTLGEGRVARRERIGDPVRAQLARLIGAGGQAEQLIEEPAIGGERVVRALLYRGGGAVR